jgi:hypothetical protein
VVIESQGTRFEVLGLSLFFGGIEGDQMHLQLLPADPLAFPSLRSGQDLRSVLEGPSLILENKYIQVLISSSIRI